MPIQLKSSIFYVSIIILYYLYLKTLFYIVTFMAMVFVQGKSGKNAFYLCLVLFINVHAGQLYY